MVGLPAANHLRSHIRNCSDIVCNPIQHRVAGVAELEAEAKVSKFQATIGGNKDIGSWQGERCSGSSPAHTTRPTP